MRERVARIIAVILSILIILCSVDIPMSNVMAQEGDEIVEHSEETDIFVSADEMQTCEAMESFVADENSEKSGERSEEFCEENNVDFLCSGQHKIAPVLLKNMHELDRNMRDVSSDVAFLNEQESNGLIATRGLMPSTGDVKSIVVMVEFSDLSFGPEFTETVVEDVFFGDEDFNDEAYPTESLAAWYKRSSYGKLDVTGEVVRIRLNKSRESYEGDTETFDVFLEDVWKALETLEITWKEYDSDDDQYIDAPCLIVAGASGEWASQWWSSMSNSEYEMQCGYKPGAYVMCMEDQISMAGARVAIHEFGHMLGLPDLYSTRGDSFLDIHRGIATWDMMATNTGDFNGFCKMLLGWIEQDNIKTIQNSEELQNIELRSYEETGDVAILFAEPDNASMFSEYFLVQFLDPQVKNAAGSATFTKKSLRIYHVNAELSQGMFKYDNYGDDIWLIRYVDNDLYIPHGNTGDYYGGFNSFSKDDSYCEFMEGDTFTPYTTPSTAAYSTSGDWLQPYEYTGIHVENIAVEGEKASFDTFYEKEPQKTPFVFFRMESGDIMPQGAVIDIRSSKELWINDASIIPYLRIKNNNEAVADVSVNLFAVHQTNDLFDMREQLYMFEATIDESFILADDTLYEIVFPAGMFVDSAGMVSETIILEVQSETNHFKEGIQQYAFDPAIYHSVSDTCAITKEGNLAVICEKTNGEVYLCIVNPNTKKMLSEFPIVYNEKILVGELKTDPVYKYALSNVENFGMTEGGNYWMTYFNPCDTYDERTMELYIFGSDGTVSAHFSPDNIYSEFVEKRFVVMYSAEHMGNVYYDIDRQVLHKGPSCIEEVLVKTLEDDRCLLFTEEGGVNSVYELTDTGFRKIRNIFIPDTQPSSVYSVIDNGVENGYSMLVYTFETVGHRTVPVPWLLELDEEFSCRRRKRIQFDERYEYIKSVEKIADGFLLELRKDISSTEGTYALFDAGFNYVKSIAAMHESCERSVRHIVNAGTEMYIIDYSAFNKRKGYTEFSFRVSEPVSVISTGKPEKTIELSKDIKIDESGRVVFYSENFQLDIDELVNSITPVANEHYDIVFCKDFRYTEEYFLIVSDADNTYKLIYPICIDGETLLDVTKDYDNLEWNVIIKNGSNLEIRIKNNGSDFAEERKYRIDFYGENALGELELIVPPMRANEIVNLKYYSGVFEAEYKDIEITKKTERRIDFSCTVENLRFENLILWESDGSTSGQIDVKNIGQNKSKRTNYSIVFKDEMGQSVWTMDGQLEEIEAGQIRTIGFHSIADDLSGVQAFDVSLSETHIISIPGEKNYEGYSFSDMTIDMDSKRYRVTVKNCGEATENTIWLTCFFKGEVGETLGMAYVALVGMESNEIMDAGGEIRGECQGIVDYEIKPFVDKFTVSLDSQGASVVGTETVKVGYGEDMPKIIVPKKEGYLFGGYFSEPGGNGVQYYDGMGLGIQKYDQFCSSTIYAYWILGQLPLPISNVETGKEVSIGTEVVLSSAVEGASVYYTLDETEPTIESTLYSEPIVLMKDTIIKAIAVKDGYLPSYTSVFCYTVVERKMPTYLVTFVSNSGNDIASQTVNEYGFVKRPTDPTREGYVFEGWYLYGELYDFSNPVTCDLVLIARWSFDENSNPGDVLEEDIPEGGIAAIPHDLWIAGIGDVDYTFSGESVKPIVRVYEYKTLLCEKKDYSIAYKNNKNAAYKGEKNAPQIVVKGKGNYGGSDVVEFDIKKKNIGDTDILIENVTQKYNGKVQNPVPTIMYNGMKLKNKRDFTVSYPDEGVDSYKNAGAYPILISGIGNYEGAVTVYFTITDGVLMSKSSVSKIGDQEYTGNEVKPAVVVKYKGELLKEGTHYIVEYVDNIEIGTATAVIIGKEGFAGEKRVKFKITGIQMKKVKVTDLAKTVVYTGDEIRPSFSVIYTAQGQNRVLVENEDYVVEYLNNIKVGTSTIIFTGVNGFTGKIKKSFKITAYDIATDKEKRVKIMVPDSVEYEKGGSKPKPVIMYGKYVLEEGRDYTLSYKRNTTLNSGNDKNKMPTVVIKGKGNFGKTISREFCILKKDISQVNISVNDKCYSNKKNGFKSIPVLTDINGKKMKSNSDYAKSYVYTYAQETITADGSIRLANEPIKENDVLKVGTLVNVRVEGAGNYYGTIVGQYRIVRKDIAKTKVTITTQYYTGDEITLSKDDIIILDGKEPVDVSQYEIVGYENNINKGNAKVILKGTGNTYGGTKTAKFKIKNKNFSFNS